MKASYTRSLRTELTKKQIVKLLEEVYKTGKKVHTQGPRVLVRGSYGKWTVEMWINRETKIVESAYPLPLP